MQARLPGLGSYDRGTRVCIVGFVVCADCSGSGVGPGVGVV